MHNAQIHHEVCFLVLETTQHPTFYMFGSSIRCVNLWLALELSLPLLGDTLGEKGKKSETD
jgi:hypothetical protein